MSDSDSDDDGLGAFSFMNKNIEVDESDCGESADETSNIRSDLCTTVETLFLLRDLLGLESLLADEEDKKQCEIDTITMAIDILNGKHINVVESVESGLLSIGSLLSMCENVQNLDVPLQIRQATFSFVEESKDDTERVCRVVQCLLLGVAYLELYCQQNYTGPELEPSVVNRLHGFAPTAFDVDAIENKIESLHQRSLPVLECDGCYVFSMSVIPHTLIIARSILLSISNPNRASWHHGIKLSDSGEVLMVLTKESIPSLVNRSLNIVQLSSIWYRGRAAMIHARLLQEQSYENLPTIWKECCDSFEDVESILICQTSDESRGNSLDQKNRSILEAQFWLEKGLSQHHFEFKNKGKECFSTAKKTAGLITELTGAMGKRTKYQQTEHAQMLLIAKSNFTNDDSGTKSIDNDLSIETTSAESNAEVKFRVVTEEDMKDGAKPQNSESKGESSGWQHSEWEVGRHLTRDVVDKDGKQNEAVVREVTLDSCDGGAEENILLEGGPKFTNGQLDTGGDLHPIDQAIILSLCLDVHNSNPNDGLTNEEMAPYLQRTLDVAKNWMIHSTALLERSWLEYEKRKTADRAMLQIQALLDQHTTKLTIMQSTYKSIHEDSAPVQDRLAFLHCIVYPAQYELKRDLAFRYLACQVIASGLAYFKELELWDEVVSCYQLMNKPHRAEMVVRERLKICETPYMMTALADLTGNEELYEKAWELSNHRYARAKRTLAKICLDRGDFTNCIRHVDDALAIHPLKATAWFMKGIACMRVQRWDEALVAFTRCTQQDCELGEAWANSGSIYMHQRDYPKAYLALEQAYKYKRDSWRLIENLMGVTLSLNKFQETVAHMNKLLDLREKSERPVHKEELRRLCFMVASINRKAVRDAAVSGKINAAQIDKDDQEFKDDLKKILDDEEDDFIFISDDNLSPSTKSVETLLVRVTSTVNSDPEIWDIFADFQISLGRLKGVMDCRVKQFRGLLNITDWHKDTEKISAIARNAKSMTAIHGTKVASKSDLYACNSLLTSAIQRVELLYADSEDCNTIKECQMVIQNLQKKI